MNKLLLLCLACLVSFAGVQIGMKGALFPQKNEMPDVHPEKNYPVTENRLFTFVVYASNQAAWCERCLSSIFSQDYESYRVILIDDASVDGTYGFAQNFVVSAAQDGRVIISRNEEKLGFFASLYKALEYCTDREIVIALEAKDWLSQEDVLTLLNSAFQNPDVWLAESSSMSYPEFQPGEERGLFAAYGALFKQLRIEDVFAGSELSMAKDAYIASLKELAGGRIRNFKEPFLFTNHAGFSPTGKAQQIHRPRVPYNALKTFPEANFPAEKADLLIFSYDRPLQLYAFLESADRYLTGVGEQAVIYRASDERYEEAYKDLKMAFPSVRWVRQGSSPHKDFKPLVLEAMKRFSSPYILFAVDDIVVKDFVDLSQCTQWMEKTGAYGFYLRLGRHIEHCYMMNQPQKVPSHLPLSSGILAWDFAGAEHDWAFSNTLDMAIYRKADLQTAFEDLGYKHPNRLEQSWASERSPHGIGLCFETSKVVNLPLNLVNPSDCRHTNFMTAEELLLAWQDGLKMNIDPLFQIENTSPHIDYQPEFVRR